MKTIFVLFFISFSAHALNSYPLQFGIGTEACHPNDDGLTQCEGRSPNHQEIQVPMNLEPEQTAAYGYYSESGTFDKIGFTVSVKIVNFPNQNIDDMLTLKVTTWSLKTPDQKQEVEAESFTRGPQNLSRLNLPGQKIGEDEDFSNVILGIKKSQLQP